MEAATTTETVFFLAQEKTVSRQKSISPRLYAQSNSVSLAWQCPHDLSAVTRATLLDATGVRLAKPRFAWVCYFFWDAILCWGVLHAG